MSLDRFAKYAWVVLVANLGVILWGAYVRASGSGAGCGSHWPLCNGEILPRAAQVETLVEFTHRMTSGLAFLLVVGLLVWARRAYPAGHQVRTGAALSMFFMVTEALVGAGLVLFELVAENASIARALAISVHLVNTFLLLAFLSLTAWWASGGRPVHLQRSGTALVLGLGLAGMLVLGTSGAVTALGDTLFPASSLAEGLRQDISSTAHILIRLRVLHPSIAVTVGAYLILAANWLIGPRQGSAASAFGRGLTLLVVVQLVAGVVNVFLLAPIWMQLVHLFLSDAIWITLVLFSATVLASQAVEVEVTPARPPAMSHIGSNKTG